MTFSEKNLQHKLDFRCWKPICVINFSWKTSCIKKGKDQIDLLHMTFSEKNLQHKWVFSIWNPICVVNFSRKTSCFKKRKWNRLIAYDIFWEKFTTQIGFEHLNSHLCCKFFPENVMLQEGKIKSTYCIWHFPRKIYNTNRFWAYEIPFVL